MKLEIEKQTLPDDTIFYRIFKDGVYVIGTTKTNLNEAAKLFEFIKKNGSVEICEIVRSEEI